MKRKFWLAVCAAVCSVFCAFGLVACGGETSAEPSGGEKESSSQSSSQTSESGSAEHVHDYTFRTETVEPNCDEGGYTLHFCECGESTSDNEKPKLGHTFENYVSNHDATCQKDGTKTAKCIRCSETDTVTDTGSQTEHIFENYVSNNDATCTKNGTKTATCRTCTEQNTIEDADSALGHSFVDYVLNDDFTCTKDGTETGKCERCPETDTRAAYGSAHHVYENYVPNRNATCELNETETGKCKWCEEENERDIEGTALGHDLHDFEAHTPDCWEDGWEAYRACSRCEYTEKEIIPALGHKYTEGVCTVCGEHKATEYLSFGEIRDNDDRDKIVGYYVMRSDAKDKDIVIPSRYNGYPVTAVYSFGNSDITSVYIPDSVKEIWDSAFKGCSELKTVRMSSSIVSVGEKAFDGCDKLEYNVYGEHHDYLGNEKTPYLVYMRFRGDTLCGLNGQTRALYPTAFTENTRIQEIVLRGITDIPKYAFGGCTALRSVKFEGANVVKIGETAFYGCTNLSDFEMPATVKEIGWYGFGNCAALKNVVLPDTLEILSLNVFFGCAALKEIVLPQAITEVPQECFAGCKALQKVVIKGKITKIQQRAFRNCEALTEINLPEGLESIADYAFENCVSLANIRLPDSVKEIQDYAFSGCGLTELVLPMELRALSGPISGSFTQVEIPAKAERISKNVFTGESLERITVAEGNKNYFSKDGILYTYNKKGLLEIVCVPRAIKGEVALHDDLTEIMREDFSGRCENITALTIGRKLAKIEEGDYFQFNWKSLQRITVSEENEMYFSHDGILYRRADVAMLKIPRAMTGKVTFPEGLKNLSYTFPEGVTEIVFPDGFKGYTFYITDSYLPNLRYNVYEGLNYIGSESNPYFLLVSAAETVTEPNFHPDTKIIGAGAFRDRRITAIRIPEGVFAIEGNAFTGCNILEYISVPSSVERVGQNAFMNVPSLYYDQGNEYEGAYYYGNEEHPYALLVKAKEDVEECAIHPDTMAVYPGAFSSSAAKILRIGKKVKTLSVLASIDFTHVFEKVYIEDIAAWCSVNLYRDNPVSAAQEVYFNGVLANGELVIPEGVTSIGDYAFKGLDITSVVLPESLKSIGISAFEECGLLKEVNLPEGLVFIGSSAFSSCALESIVIPESVKYVGDGMLLGTLVSEATAPLRFASAVWNIELERLVLTSGEVIEDEQFKSTQINNAALTSVVLPAELKVIGNRAFGGCRNLTFINFPEGLIYIGNSAFGGCNLESAVLPDGLKYLGVSAFEGCENLKTVHLPNSMKEIPESLFAYCNALEEAEIPDGVTKIDRFAFANCALTAVRIPSSVTEIDREAFYNTYPEELEIPARLSEDSLQGLLNGTLKKLTLSGAGVLKMAFCLDSLTEIVLGEGFTAIGENAFRDCRNLKSIRFPSTLKEIGDGAFEDCQELEIVIPVSVISIGEHAFGEYTSELTYQGTKEQWNAVKKHREWSLLIRIPCIVRTATSLSDKNKMKS